MDTRQQERRPNLRDAVWVLGVMSTLAGAAAVFLIAPLAVHERLDVAYRQLVASPNLLMAVSFGVVWALLAVAITAGIARLAACARGLTTRVAACFLVVGLLLTGLILTSATMSNAIADGSSSNWAAAELPAWVLGWVGTVSLALAAVALTGAAWRHARERRNREAHAR